MSTRNMPIDTGFRTPVRRTGVHQWVVYLLLAALVLLIAACKSSPAATEQWLPPYLQLRLHTGKARVQWTGASGWMTIEGRASILIEETVRIVADAAEGAQFYLGDGSMLELAPEAVLEARNPRTMPRLQVALQEGSLLFVAQNPSYELVTPSGSVTLLSVPSRIGIEVDGETMHLTVEEGAVTCMLEGETVTLLASQELYASPGEAPEITEFYDASATATASALALSASPTPSELEATPTPTATMTPTPSPTATPTRRRVVLTPTPTPLPPTNTPKPSSPHAPPPPPPTQPPPTQSPPTQPPPTEPPPTQPRPTLPRPTDPPPTQPPPSPTQPPPEQPPTEPPPTEPPPTEPPPTEPPPPTDPPPTVPSG